MKKFRLKLDDLQVASFTTAEGGAAKLGTVRGRSATADYTCNSCYDAGCNSANFNCDGGTDFGTCFGCVDDGGGGGTIGIHCGPQGTMNPLWGTCVINTMAGGTCNGGATCGPETVCYC